MAIQPLDWPGALSLSKRLDRFAGPLGGPPRNDILQTHLGGPGAGLIFATGFREAANPSLLFGANLIGAMIGGCAEYLGMAVGNHHLSCLVIAAYAGSLLCLMMDRRGALPAVATA